MNTIHYLNGKFVKEEELLISPRDLGFTRGYAVFDFFRTYNGHKPFMFKYHIDRLFNSAKAIDLTLPWSKDEIKRVVLETLAKNDKSKEFVVRILLSGGVPDSSNQINTTSLIIMLDEPHTFPKDIYEKGIKVTTLNYKRIVPGAKTTHYIEAIKNADTAQAQGSDELLYVSDGFILEGAYSNFFCVINGKLVTAEKDILPGITRLVITQKLKINAPIEIRDIKYDELKSASEAFISVSNKGIVPVVKIDTLTIGDGKVGQITKNVMTEFNNYIANGEW